MAGNKQFDLDVDDIKVVINYDYPNNSEDYVHRIGRTGRRDKKGVAHTFFTNQNAPKARDLIKVLQEANQTVPPELMSLANSGGGNGRSRGGGVGRSRYAGKRPGDLATGGNDINVKRGNYDNSSYSNNYGSARW